MATYFMYFGLFLYSFIEIDCQKPKTISANSGTRSFVFSAKNQFSFSQPKGGNKGSTGNGGSKNAASNTISQQKWKQIPFNFEQKKNQPSEQSNQMSQQGQQQMPQGQHQMQQQQFQNQHRSMSSNGFQNGQQQFNNPMGMGNQPANQFNQPNLPQQQRNFNQMQPGFNQYQQQQHQQQMQPQLSNMNPGQSQMFKQTPQQMQHQQQTFGQSNNPSNMHSGQFGGVPQNNFNGGGHSPGNGINVLSQNKPSNTPPFQGMNTMSTNQGFHGNQPHGHMSQYNPQRQGFMNPMSGQHGGQMSVPGPQNMGQGQNMPHMQNGQIGVPSPHSQAHGNVQLHVPGVGNMPSPQGNQVHGPSPPSPQGQNYMVPNKHPNLAVIDHPVKSTTTTTPKPPTSTVDGEGFVCMTTADCEIGCCFNSTGQLLDTTTYGPGGVLEGRASGKCFIRSPDLGDVCDDLCPCKMGHDCYRRYIPNYPKPGEKMPPPPDPEGGPKPQRKCVRNAVIESERRVFWKCYFDQACSGPLP